MSPILFNMVLDELLANLDPGISYKVETFALDTTAFDDDLMVFASMPSSLQARLNEFNSFSHPRNLDINTTKSVTFFLCPSLREHKMTVAEMAFTLRVVPLNTCGASSTSTYLGVDFTPLGHCQPSTNVEVLLDRVSKVSEESPSPLKPQQ